MDDKAPIGCTPVQPQDQQQPPKPRLFQAGDKVKVKGREGVYVLEVNPDYLHRSNYPLIIELPHLNGTIAQEEFTETGHWLIKHQEEGLPPVLELVKEEQLSDNGKISNSEAVNHPHHYGGENNQYEAIKVIEAWGLDFCMGNAVKYISRAGKKDDIVQDLKKAKWYLERKIGKLETVGSSEAKALADDLTKGENGDDEWACTRDTLPEKGQRVVVKMANGNKNYGTYTGNGVFWVVVPLEYHDAKGVWRDYRFPYVRKWKPFG